MFRFRIYWANGFDTIEQRSMTDAIKVATRRAKTEARTIQGIVQVEWDGAPVNDHLIRSIKAI